MLDANLYNGLTLAYIGDAYFELFVRNKALALGKTKVKNIHEYVTSKVCAKSQANYVRKLLEADILTEEEKGIYNRGRNAQVNSVRKIDMNIYHESTGFEAIIGYLYLKKNFERLECVFEFIFEVED